MCNPIRKRTGFQSRALEPIKFLLGEDDADANGACSDAKLFICSPHSCEVVKTVFSRSFGDVNLKRGLRDGNPQVLCSVTAMEAGTTADARPEWKALCGRSQEVPFVGKRRTAGPDQETSL